MLNSPELFVGKTLWGVAEAGDPSKWDGMLARTKQEGYTFVESILIFDVNLDRSLFRQLLDKHGLELVVQLHTASDWKCYDYCTSCELEEHVLSFRALLQEVLSSELRPKIINVHSGHDNWDIDTAVSYFQQVLQIEAELLVGEHKEVLLVHETHRQRLLHSPYQTRDILTHPALQQQQPRSLKLNCDLSHWVVVCEKVFDAKTDARDKWWPAVLALTARHCRLVHGRYGHAEGPQLIDPRTEAQAQAQAQAQEGEAEGRPEVAAHNAWWTAIFSSQRDRGCSSVVITEHGPEPYQSYHAPFASTSKATAAVGCGTSLLTDEEKSATLWDINSFVKENVTRCYESLP